MEERCLLSHSGGIPDLHSRPIAPAAIYMDFDGDAATVTTAYDEDGDAATFNPAEQTHITEAWRQMSLYFAIFDVDVTTEPTTKPKAWVAIGNNIVGGYSFVDVFPNSKPESFNQSADARDRVSGLAHEIGHNFGLQHQSDYNLNATKTNEYTNGFDVLHGALMGVDYAQDVHKWFVGHPATSPSNLQDDLALIASKIKPFEAAGGDGFRPDDFGGTIAAATPLPVIGSTQSSTGIIERLGDGDAFSFSSSGGTFSISARPDAPSGVDLRVEIYGIGGTLLAASDDPNSNGQQITMTLGSGTYYAVLSSHGDYGDVGQYSVTIQPSSLPAGWNTQDIGLVGVAGAAGFDSASGTYSVSGSGSDIGGTRDQFRYTYVQLTGNGSITARVASQQNTNGSAKSGVMIRENTGAASKQATVVVTPGNGVAFQRRTSTGGSSTSTSALGPTAPYWVRLVRSGNTITGSRSADGIAWTTVGTDTISMTSTVYIGLAVASHDNAVLGVSTFDTVSYTGNVSAPTATNGLTVPTGLTVTRGTGTDLALSWTDTTAETGYAIDRSIDGVTFTQIATTAANVTSFTDPGLFGSLRYFYRVSALDGTGESAPSAVVSAVNRPSAVTNFAVTSWTRTNLILNWRDTSGESGYRIERSTNGTTFTTVATVGANIPSWTDSGLKRKTKYFYRVIALSSFGDSPVATASGTTKG